MNFKSKFLEKYKIVMNDILKESTFKSLDFGKHSYLTDVKNDILSGNQSGNHLIKIGNKGEKEVEINGKNWTPDDKTNFKDIQTVKDFNDFLKHKGCTIEDPSSDGKSDKEKYVTWGKIWKQAYSGKSEKHPEYRKNSTENSSITELIPCILLTDKSPGINYSFDDFSWFETISGNLLNNKYKNIFLNKNDEESAKLIFRNFDFNDNKNKVKAGLAIFNALNKKLSDDKVNVNKDGVKWTYRSKPAGIDADDPSDFVIKTEDGEIIGISCKAGISSSHEVSRNSSVNAILAYFPDKVKDFYSQFYEKTCEIFEQTSGFTVPKSTEEISKSTEEIPESTEEIPKIPEIKKYLNLKKNNANLFKSIKKDGADSQYGKAQKWIIEYFREKLLNNLDATKNEEFMNFFKTKGLGISTSNKFYIIKGYHDGSAEIKEFNRNINKLQTQSNGQSHQSFNIICNKDLTCQCTIRTHGTGAGFWEMPNLKVLFQPKITEKNP